MSVGGQKYDSITDDFTRAQKTLFNDTNGYAKRGGMKSMGEALDRGVVLVMSLWADYAVHMLWLDSDYPTDQPTSKPGIARGTCATTTGVPADIINNSPDAQVGSRVCAARCADLPYNAIKHMWLEQRVAGCAISLSKWSS